jgi:hypothetical protein
MGGFYRIWRVVKSSKNFVPPARLERTTPGLGRRMRMKMEVIDVTVIAETAVRYRVRALSNQFPFV